jgi:hypothetical protein
VQRASGRVALEPGEVDRLRHDSLAGEGGVTVDEDRERLRGVVLAGARGAVGLLGARPALDDRVDELEVAGVRTQRHPDRPGRRRPGSPHAEVVLDVARAPFGVGRDGLERALALELAHDRLVGPPNDVREDVQTAAVRHSHHDVLRAAPSGELDRLVEHRHQHVEPLDRELFLAEECALQVLLEHLHLAEPLQ